MRWRCRNCKRPATSKPADFWSIQCQLCIVVCDDPKAHRASGGECAFEPIPSSPLERLAEICRELGIAC